MPANPARAVTWIHRLAREPDGRDDRQLLDAFLDGREEAAFAELLRRHGPLVLGVCRRLLHDSHDVDDAFQATFLVLIRKARSIARREQLAAWLYGVAFRTAQKARFRRNRRATVERQVDVASEPAQTVAESADAAELLDRELLALPEKYRVPLVLCELRGLSRRDAARQLQLAEGTLSSRLARGRVLLRRRLERAGVTLPAAGLLATLATEAQTNIPEMLFQSTLNGATAGAAVAAGVQSLAEGVLKTMLLDKVRKTTLAVLLVAGLTGLGVLAVPNSPAAPPTPSTSAAPSDRDRLQGTWALMKLGDRDATTEEKQASLGELTFRSDHLIDTFSSGGVREVPFRIDEKQNPKHLDWSIPPGRQNADGFRRAWIYQLDSDTLTLCGKVSETAEDERPSEFKNAVKTKQYFIRVLTYRRSGASKVAPAVKPAETVLLGGLKKLDPVIEPPDKILFGVITNSSKQYMDVLVRPDGTVALGTYGSVHVAGLTERQAAVAIEKHLYKMNNTEQTVIIKILENNSKHYYVIVEGDDVEQVYRFPFTGNETVTDAISQVADLPKLAAGRAVRVTRGDQTLDVDWLAIQRRGETATNYALRPGDRIHVAKRRAPLDYRVPVESKPAQPKPLYVANREFAIPFGFNNSILKPGEKLTPRVSEDRGRTWQRLQSVNPEDKLFRFLAPDDGEYWFGISRDSDPSSAITGLIVVVDTKAPTIVVRDWQDGKDRRLEWTIRDENLDIETLNVSYRDGKNEDWQTLPVTATAEGRHSFAGRTATTEVRIQVRDKARNRAEVIFPYGEKAGPRTGTLKLSAPVPLEPKGEVWTKFGLRVTPAAVEEVTKVNPNHKTVTLAGWRAASAVEEVAKVNPNLKGGLAVTDVRPGSPASQAGIRSGDILVGLDRYETVTMDNISWLANQRDLSRLGSIKFYVIRDGKVHRGEMALGE